MMTGERPGEIQTDLERPAANDRAGLRQKSLWIAGAAIVAGVALRIWIFSTPIGALDSDEAVIGLMARHVLDGEFSTFYWGQPYGGSVAALLTSAVFAVVGASVASLKVVPLGLAAAATWLVYCIGRRTIGGTGARLSAAIYLIWPAIFVWWSVRWATYLTTLVLGLIVALECLRLADPNVSSSRKKWESALAGLALGLGWWSSPQIVYLAAPALLWLLFKVRVRILQFWMAVPAALLGAAPWIRFNFATDWLSLQAGPQPVHRGYLGNLVTFFERALPVALGLRAPYSEDWIPLELGPVLYLGGLLAFAAGLTVWIVRAVRARGRPMGSLRPSQIEGGPPSRNAALLFLIALSYPLLFAISPFSWWVADGRYLLYLAPVFTLLIGWGLSDLLSGMRLGSHGAALALLVFAVGSGTGTATMIRQDLVAPYAPDVHVPSDFSTLADTLETEKIERVFADYWVAYRLTFESQEKIIAAPLTGTIRYQPHVDEVAASFNPSYVIVAASAVPSRFEEALERRGLEFERIEAGDFTIYTPARKVLPREIPEVWLPAEEIPA